MCYEKFLNIDLKPGWVPETLKMHTSSSAAHSGDSRLPTSVTVQLADAKSMCQSSAALSVVSAEQKVSHTG